MPKRKRSETSLKDRLDKSHQDVYKALKAAKGFERQRLGKRVNDADVTPDKKERLEREIAVLKASKPISLDLQQTALAHLYSSLLKVKSIAASTDLPDEIRAGVPKPELSEQEKVALHNVTSGLYNRGNVKQSIERAITAVCESLGVPHPSKESKHKKKDSEAKLEKEGLKQASTEKNKTEVGEAQDDETDFEGFSSDVDQPGPALGDPEGDEDEEAEVSMYDHLLGASSDEEDDFDEETLAKYRGKETVNLDDISLSGSASELESGEESDEESEAASSDRAPSPPAKKAKSSSDDKKRKKAQPTAPARDSTFLPSLMGGYISGSESASDVDVAPPKKRRGQRQRQAIYEKKYGAKANHLKKENKKGGGSGRDQGWDMRRGAVDGDSGGGRRTPWKKGIQNPLAAGGSSGGGDRDTRVREQAKPTKRDDEGPLHPSWEARKKAKDSAKTAVFAGSKITFD